MPSNFKRTLILFSLIGIMIATSSCGRLDPKKDASRTLLPGRDMGCYDKLGERVTRYLNGQIEAAEWEDTFNCVNDQLTFFKKYVRGNIPGGYNQADIGALVRKFLISNRPISDQFIISIFDFKASVFGGSPAVITTEQINEFLSMSEVLRTETLLLLPALQGRKRNPNSKNLLKLSDAMGNFGAHLGNFLDSLGGDFPVKKESFLPFLREILVMHGGDASLVDKYGDFGRNLKVIIAGGTPDVIESSSWSSLIREGAALGGLLLASRDMDGLTLTQPEDRDLFNIEIAKRTQIILNRIIGHHGSGISLELLNPIIDSFPSEQLTLARRGAIKQDLGALVFKVLRSGIKNKLTIASVRSVMDLYISGMRSQLHLKKIYSELPAEVSAKDFEVAARRYLFSADTGFERIEINRLIEISKSYFGLFAEGTGEMEFSNVMRETRSLNHMTRMSWFNLIIRHAFSVYATGPEIVAGAKSARTEDLAELTIDFLHILTEWKMANPIYTPMEMAIKRFREGNLFMPTANGDSYFDQVEATYYLAFLFSASANSSRTYSAIKQNSPQWSACPIVGVDELGQDAFAADCFRKVYFSNPQIFWTSFPGLQAAYGKLTDAQKQVLANSIERGARRGGYSEKPIGPYDIDSFAALPHYVEDIMERFDVNDDEVLDKREVLQLAYPIFKETLSRAAKGQKSDLILKGILTYIIHYGVPPSNTVKLLAWSARLPFMNVVADRNALYKVVAILSSPIEMSKNTTGSSWPMRSADFLSH